MARGRTFFGGEGLFLPRCTGTGPLFLSSYGAVEARELRDAESFTVDTGHIVAFEETVTGRPEGRRPEVDAVLR